MTTVKTDSGIINYAYIKSFPGSEDGSSSIRVSLDSPLTLSPGVYEFVIWGTVDGNNFYRTLDIDVTNEDQTINFSDFILQYNFDVTEAGSSEDDYLAEICYYHGDYWRRYINNKKLKKVTVSII